MTIQSYRREQDIEDHPELQDDPAFNFYYWGPLLMKFKVSDYLCDEMMKRAESLTIEKNDARHTLAADIQKELSYTPDDKQFFVERTNKVFMRYMRYGRENWFKPNENRAKNPSNKKLGHFDAKSITLNGLWINYMRAGEYNPPHEHDSDLSFVMFTQVPEEIAIENKSNITTSAGPGMLNFLYGEGMPGYAGRQSFMPTKGDFFIFPAKLLHFVAPFKSDVTRISIAGNLEFAYT